jgi:ferredoxin
MKPQSPVHLRVGPAGIGAEWIPGESLFTALRRQGWLVGSACRGEGICGRCGLEVKDPAGGLEPSGDQERRVKVANQVPDEWRLSCLLICPGQLPDTTVIQVDSPAW